MLLGAWFSFFFFFFGIVKVGKYALKRTLQVIKLRCQVVGKKNTRGWRVRVSNFYSNLT